MYQKEEQIEKCDYLHIHQEKADEVQKSLPAEEVLYDLADFYKVFSDSTRIRILFVLLQDEMCVCDIACVLGMSQSSISHQLRVLKQMDLVRNRRDGKTVFYSLADSHIFTILSQGLEHISEEK